MEGKRRGRPRKSANAELSGALPIYDAALPDHAGSCRINALALAVQSYGTQTTPGSTQSILQRAREFAKFLDGDAENPD